MKLFISYILFAIAFANYCHAQQRDFGDSGTAGLTAQQLTDLSKGNIVFLKAQNGDGAGKSALTEAAIVFSTSPETTWKLISKTEDQANYIEGCKKVNVISKTAGKAYEVYMVGNWLVTCTYGVVENYLPESMCICWSLDTSYSKNDLNALTGYWQFYPYGNGHTLARYGTFISFKNIPAFVENHFKKDGIKDALASVKKYVDSGGTYQK